MTMMMIQRCLDLHPLLCTVKLLSFCFLDILLPFRTLSFLFLLTLLLWFSVQICLASVGTRWQVLDFALSAGA